MTPGQIQTCPLGERDAFHAPAVVVYCLEELKAGQDIRFIDSFSVLPCSPEERQAIVDPFLPDKVRQGTKFLAFIPPGTDLKLKHHFTTDFLPDPEEEEEDFDDECRGCY